MSETEARGTLPETDARVAELAERLAEARGELDALTYAISHDLRAPLRTVYGFVQLLERKYRERLEGQAIEYLERIGSGIQRMEKLIADLLELSRTGTREMQRERVDLSALAHALLEDLRKSEPGRVVEVSVEPGLVVSGDPVLLRALLHHLLGNAWKFTGGKPSAHITFGTRTTGEQRQFCVIDNGAGFTPGQAHRLFNPFQRLHLESEFPGTGIGLAVVKKIVVRHGGTVTGEGEEGKGAAFCFTLAPELDQPV
ncbi:ATP-binding protein [Geobacter sp. DSM 9736]|uniref:sensor histidine kinase n=1 Tax=Geobacter sp. DSM 9736 TaxID=1277350 RepID=UPI000B61EED7|nr:ATP-binding protein [Geobacter sp. DSM 9736]SNB46568.1 His Kinase A (phospho-acceptor) domain-containing protein [Geobacter sp. DSM 9736]